MARLIRFLLLPLSLLVATAITGPAADAETTEEVIADLSQNHVAITTRFVGSEILVFGAIRREAPPPDESPPGIIITISGPSEAIVVRRKARRAGIWVNADALHVDSAPSFYAVSSTAPLREILIGSEDLAHKISIRQAISSFWTTQLSPETPDFIEALIRLRRQDELYQMNEGGVRLRAGTLFRTSVRLPSNLVEGTYSARVFLTRKGRVIDTYKTAIEVNKVGMERWIFNLAHQRPLIYGLLSIIIAIIAGWGASSAFRYLRG